MVAAAVMFLSIAYDKHLWLASAEPRWMLLHFSVVLAGAIYLSARLGTGLRVSLDQPWPVWMALLFGWWALLSMIDTLDRLNGWWTLKNVMACIGLFGLVVALRSEHWYWSLAWVLTLAVGFNGLLGALQFHGIDDQRIAGHWGFWAELGPMMGYFAQQAVPAATFINKNAAASYLVLTVPIAFAVFLGSRGRFAQVVAILCFVLGATLLVYTRTRSSWLGAVVSMALFGLAVLLSKPVRSLLRSSFSRGHALLAGIGLGLIVLAIDLPARLPADTFARGMGEQLVTLLDVRQPSYVVRWANNLNSLKLAGDHPWNGVGLGAFRAAYPPYHTAWMEAPNDAYDVGLRWNYLHNDWLQAFVELGVVGGLALIGFFVAVGTSGWKLATREASARTRLFSLFTVIGITALCIDALANFPMQLPTAGLMWCLAGCVTGLSKPTAQAPAELQSAGGVATKPVVWAVGLAVLAASILIIVDDLRRWQSGYHLTVARRLNYSNGDLGRALTEIDQAYAIYPYSDMVQETRALTYSRDAQGRWVSPERIIDVVEESLRHDPYSSYLLISLGKLYAHHGLLALQRDDEMRTAKYGDKLTAVLSVLRRVDNGRAELPAFAGYLALLKSEPAQAIPLFEDAMRINPKDPFVTYGADLAQHSLVRRERSPRRAERPQP